MNQRTQASIARWAVWLAVFSTIVFLPGAFDRWVLPKEAVVAIAAVLASLLPARGRLPLWLWLIMGGAGLALVSSALLGAAPLAQLFGRWPRYEGLVSLPVYLAAAWSGARLLGPRAERPALVSFRRAVAVAALLLGAVSLAESAGLRPISTSLDRPGALLGNATDQGVVGVMFFAVLVIPAFRGWLREGVPVRSGRAGRRTSAPAAEAGSPWLSSLAVLASVVTVVASASRAAAVGFGVVVVGAVALELVRRRVTRLVAPDGQATRRTTVSRRRPALIATGVFLAFTAATVVAFPLLWLRMLGLTPLASATVDDRGMIANAALSVSFAHPALGVGPSGFVDAVPSFLGADWYQRVGADTTLDSPHNWILQALVAGGIPVLVLSIGLAAITAWVGVSRWRTQLRASLPLPAGGARSAADPVAKRTAATGSAAKPARGAADRADLLAGAGLALAGFAVALLTAFTAPGTMVFAALLLGILVSAASTTAPVHATFRQIIRTAALGIWACALVVAALSEVPLASGVSDATAGRLTAADASFSLARALRPWDADLSSIAAQVFAQEADRQVAGAAPLAVEYGETAVAATPESVAALKALAVGRQYSGDLAGAASILSALTSRVPFDAGVLQRLGTVQILQLDYPAAEASLRASIALQPDNASAWQALSFLYQKTGDQAAESAASDRAAALGIGQ